MKTLNYKTITIQEQKQLMLDELLYIDSFCKKNGITYFLSDGTLLGAIRHKGFIPWDDDIDISMKREDYERFLEIFNSNNSARYSVISRNTNKKFYLPYAKVIDNRTVLQENFTGAIPIGVYVDIFPLEYITNETKSRLSKLDKKSISFENILFVRALKILPKRKFVKNITILILRIFCPLPFYYSAILTERRIKKFVSKKKTDWILNPYFFKSCSNSSCFDSTIEVNFEGYKLPAPIGYDEYLTNAYGDYMTPPSVEKRVSTHAYNAYWK